MAGHISEPLNFSDFDAVYSYLYTIYKITVQEGSNVSNPGVILHVTFTL